MSKYLILKFRNAKLFRNSPKCGDYVFDVTGQRKRAGQLQFVEPITVHQVSNMLHVLFNERPVPSFRKSFYGNIEHYFKMAQESLIRVDGYKRFNKNKNQEEFVKEFLMTKKSVFNSYNPNSLINWEIVKEYCEEDFNDIIIAIQNIIGFNPKDVTFDEVRELLQSYDISEFSKTLKEKKLTALSNYIKDTNTASEMTRKASTALINNNGIDNVAILGGEIIVTVSEDDLIKLSNSKGCATILDGGLVWIDSVKDGMEISDYGFTKVNEISTEKY